MVKPPFPRGPSVTALGLCAEKGRASCGLLFVGTRSQTVCFRHSPSPQQGGGECGRGRGQSVGRVTLGRSKSGLTKPSQGEPCSGSVLQNDSFLEAVKPQMPPRVRRVIISEWDGAVLSAKR